MKSCVRLRVLLWATGILLAHSSEAVRAQAYFFEVGQIVLGFGEAGSGFAGFGVSGGLTAFGSGTGEPTIYHNRICAGIQTGSGLDQGCTQNFVIFVHGPEPVILATIPSDFHSGGTIDVDVRCPIEGTPEVRTNLDDPENLPVTVEPTPFVFFIPVAGLMWQCTPSGSIVSSTVGTFTIDETNDNREASSFFGAFLNGVVEP